MLWEEAPYSICNVNETGIVLRYYNIIWQGLPKNIINGCVQIVKGAIIDSSKISVPKEKWRWSIMDCIFCKIANGEISSATLYEDEDFRVILDLNPASKGHALILPKNHADNLYALPEEAASKVLVLAKNMALKMKKALNCDGLNLVQNNGEIAGQTVFHFHMHLIPRYEGDNVKVGWKPGKLTDEVKEELLSILT